ncbi:hypothetical protein J5069_09295 [Candidatus Symbiopectobacterium sp. NZEC127]|uniref:hypothetical protein n=1 Tax=Candidatus Symbiopectobacterium sp. NZEC127 TaxID=2820472 RepID=UPI002227082F|nr:hypothetical protein [Candidatus Symbiopectobacterium sp. NZEC127]MCW2486088.1 hypothetical protein [Candidatus Symbiopectobacterium sp. NZEC127]
MDVRLIIADEKKKYLSVEDAIKPSMQKNILPAKINKIASSTECPSGRKNLRHQNQTVTKLTKTCLRESNVHYEDNNLSLSTLMARGHQLYVESERLKTSEINDKPVLPDYSLGRKSTIAIGLIMLGGTGWWLGYSRYRQWGRDSIQPISADNGSIYPAEARYPDQKITIEKYPDRHEKQGYTNEANVTTHFPKARVLYVRKRHIEKETETKKNAPAYDDVKIIKLTDCRDERERLALSDILRVISKTIRYPISSLIEEGRIVLDYSIYAKGCVDHSKFNSISQKIESAINSLLSWIPMYNRTHLITLIAATVLDMISDAIEGKELSLSYIEDIDNNIINLAKDMISSLSTIQINNMIKPDGQKEINAMTNDVKYRKGKLIIRTAHPIRDIPVKNFFNHFIDERRNKYLFYENNHWVVNRNIQFNHEVKKTKRLIDKIWRDEKGVFYFRNSSPEFYGDSILIRHLDELYIVIGNRIYPAKEFQVNPRVFRYLALKHSVYVPVVQRAGKWVFESKITHSASSDLVHFLTEKENIKNRLVRNHVAHSDVGPITLSRKFQFDKNYNRYLKINEGYYRVKQDVFGSLYVDGHRDILPLREKDSQFYTKSYLAEGQFSYYKKALQKPFSSHDDKNYYLDNSVVERMPRSQLFMQAKSFSDDTFLAEHQYDRSQKIDGAYVLDGKYFFLYNNKMIAVTDLGNDYFLLPNERHADDGIFLYKNSRGNTYYSFQKKSGIKINKYNTKTLQCKVKRQVPSGCMNAYYETAEFTSLLKRNVDNGIKLFNAKEMLEPYRDLDGFYRNKNDENKLYYFFNDNVYFHASEVDSAEDRIAPVYFKLYGKNAEGEINPSFVISDVCIIKDFYDKKTIVSTPIEAQEIVLDLDKTYSQKLLRWQQRSSEGIIAEKGSEDIEQLLRKLHEKFDSDEVTKLFDLSSKKSITSIKDADYYINNAIKEIINRPDSFDYITLASIENEKSDVILSAIFNEAYSNAIEMVDKSSRFVKSDRYLADEYIIERLKISDKRVIDIFIDSFTKISGRINQLFSMHNKENIILIVRNKNHPIASDKKNIDVNRNVLGFSFINDPLDRVFLNTDIIPDDLTMNASDYEGFSQQEYYVNLMSGTLCHEAIHALGNPDDYFYHRIDENGKLQQVEDAIDRIEYFILTGNAFNDRFVYLCKSYFMSNPIYAGVNIESLMKPAVFHQLFVRDNYLRAIVLLNNPDTLTLLIRDFARDHVLLL